LWQGSSLENGPVRAHIGGMSEPKREDIDKQGGWLVRVVTPPSLDRLFYVYELDWAKAKQLVKAKVPVRWTLARPSKQSARPTSML
jgi:hypothetical protein